MKAIISAGGIANVINCVYLQSAILYITDKGWQRAPSKQYILKHRRQHTGWYNFWKAN